MTRTFPIFAQETRANPHPVYDLMRQTDPIYRAIGPMTGNIMWFFTEYADVQTVLKDVRFVKDGRKNLPREISRKYFGDNPNPIFEAVERHMLNLDAPDHTRLRNLIHRAFTPRMIQELHPRIVDITQHLLDAMASKTEADLIQDFAYPLPITVIAELLGVDANMRDKFREWSRVIVFETSEAESLASVMEFVQYINELIEERRSTPKNDILSGLVHAHIDGDSLDHMELLSMVMLLLVAGHETTVNLIGNGTLSLLQHPDQLAKLRENPALINSAVEEMLRFNGPIETPTLRFASENITIGNQTIEVGDLVYPSLIAANRDPKVFENPHTFDITRNPNPHVAFGYGVHYCVGAPLARMEGTIAINALIQRFPNLQLNIAPEDLQWTFSLLFHGVNKLPVRF